MIYIYDFFGTHQINTIEEFKSAIRKIDEKLFSNNIEIMHDNKNIYPYLNIFVKKNLAAAYYFKKEGDSPFASEAPDPPITIDDIEFYERKTGEANFFSFENIIYLDDALKAAEEFFYSRSMPSAINWMQP